MTSRRLRYEILRRDNHTCRYCGATAPNVEVAVDHVVPRALGGTDDPSNLVTACVDCNNGKASVTALDPLVNDVHRTAWRWQQAQQTAVAEWRANRVNHEAAADAVELFDQKWTEWRHDDGSTAPRPADWDNSVRHWLTYGLTGDDIASFIHRAMALEPTTKWSTIPEWRWRYLCGCVWNVIREIDDRTTQLAEPENDDAEPVVSDDRGTFLPGTGWIQ